MKKSLLEAGWREIAKGDSFFDALTSIEPESNDGRGPRFTEVQGKFYERCKILDTSKQRWYYGYEEKSLLVHTMGEFFAHLTEEGHC